MKFLAAVPFIATLATILYFLHANAGLGFQYMFMGEASFLLLTLNALIFVFYSFDSTRPKEWSYACAIFFTLGVALFIASFFFPVIDALLTALLFYAVIFIYFMAGLIPILALIDWIKSFINKRKEIVSGTNPSKPFTLKSWPVIKIAISVVILCGVGSYGYYLLSQPPSFEGWGPCDPTQGACPDKPVIYLYPTQPESVNVTLNYAGTLTTLYPSFNEGSTWNVTAYPDGRIIDNGKEYSYLFWEGEDNHRYDMSSGFVVKGSDTAAFLQQQLSSMGLLPKEYNEFIVYWLPQLENNPYNLIHFAGSDYTNIAKLSITPTPDSMLRVFMVYEPLTAPIIVPAQTFPPFVRKGFTVVEWGGTEF